MSNRVMLDSATVAENVDQLLRENERSRRWLARQLNTNDVWVGRRLNGKTKFSLDEVERFAAVLNVDPEQLFIAPSNGEGARHASA